MAAVATRSRSRAAFTFAGDVGGDDAGGGDGAEEEGRTTRRPLGLCLWAGVPLAQL